jgi:hypothetical protein
MFRPGAIRDATVAACRVRAVRNDLERMTVAFNTDEEDREARRVAQKIEGVLNMSSSATTPSRGTKRERSDDVDKRETSRRRA